MKKHLLFITIAFCALLIIATGQKTKALAADASSGGVFSPQAGQYQQLSPLTVPGTSGSTAVNTNDFPSYLQAIYRIGIGACFVLGVIMFTWAGIEYIITESISGKSSAKARIVAALTGLALALVSYILLNTINPDLLKFSNILPQNAGTK